MKRFVLAALVLGALIGGATMVLAHSLGPVTLSPLGPAEGYDQAQQLIELINQARWDDGQLPPLKRAAEVDAAAQRHSQDMSDNDFFGHVGSDDSQFWERMEDAGYTNLVWSAENIAAGQSDAYTVMWHPDHGWMYSSGHRHNVLTSEAREMGVGYVYELDDVYPPDETWAYHHYWTLNVGARQGVFPMVINREAYSTTSRVVSLYLYGQGWASEMRFSNDGNSWSIWETFGSDKTWELSGSNGLKTVWAQIRRVGETKTVSDTILLNTPTPVLSVVPTTLTFLAQSGSGTTVPVSHSLQVSNVGGGSLAWTASPQQTWIEALPLSGSGDADVSVWVQNLGTLGPGVHSGTLTVSSDSPDVQNSPKTITVTVSVVDELRFIYLPLLCK